MRIDGKYWLPQIYCIFEYDEAKSILNKIWATLIFYFIFIEIKIVITIIIYSRKIKENNTPTVQKT